MIKLNNDESINKCKNYKNRDILRTVRLMVYVVTLLIISLILSYLAKGNANNQFLLLKNISFEEIIPDKGDNGKTFDPDKWGVCEGKTEKGTANVIEEYPELIQVVSKENSVLPYEGNKMLKIDARLYIKTNVRQYYNQSVADGKLVQEIYLYPFIDEYLQQIEVRETKDKGRTRYKKG
jgi:hypothetical protein